MEKKNHPNYFVVWIWLMGLLIASFAVSLVLPRSAAVYLIFLVAAIKAILVVMNFMHLKYEKLLLYALAIVPLLIVVVLLFALFPDFVFHG
jgi:caa(3)-type oxidase subunit IV